MANNVFANGREISCKAGDGKSIASFPDVCMTPPENPTTPPGVPIPYPNTGMASDTTSGSKKVKISDKEVMLKNKSYFKKSTGDEAGSATKKGVVTSVNRGKVYFNAWSMDVKVEGENVVRHLDLTTHNHASQAGNTAPWPYADRMAMAKGLKSCEDEVKAVEDNCKQDEDGNVECPDDAGVDYHDDASMEAYALRVENDPCQRAARCILSSWKPSTCCPPQTPHHLIPKASFFDPSYAAFKRGEGTKLADSYDENTAPCVCAEGGKTAATHGLLHAAQADELSKLPASKQYDFGTASDIAAKNMKDVFPNAGKDGKGCSENCTRAQLRREGQKGINRDTPLMRRAQEPKDPSALAALDKFKASHAKVGRPAGVR